MVPIAAVLAPTYLLVREIGEMLCFCRLAKPKLAMMVSLRGLSPQVNKMINLEFTNKDLHKSIEDKVNEGFFEHEKSHGIYDEYEKFHIIAKLDKEVVGVLSGYTAVSYTHLTLPTKA